VSCAQVGRARRSVANAATSMVGRACSEVRGEPTNGDENENENE
jgi:hypothetical protein